MVTTLASGSVVTSDKMLVALGRAANIEGLNLAAAGLAPTARGLLAVDDFCRTAVPHIYAVGDVIGPAVAGGHGDGAGAPRGHARRWGSRRDSRPR